MKKPIIFVLIILVILIAVGAVTFFSILKYSGKDYNIYKSSKGFSLKYPKGWKIDYKIFYLETYTVAFVPPNLDKESVWMALCLIDKNKYNNIYEIPYPVLSERKGSTGGGSDIIYLEKEKISKEKKSISYTFGLADQRTISREVIIKGNKYWYGFWFEGKESDFNKYKKSFQTAGESLKEN